MSMSDISAALLFLLIPLRHRKADRRMAKDTFALIQDMVVAKSSPFFNASSSARRLWNLLNSSAIPPVLVKTKGVNVDAPLPNPAFCIASSSHFHEVGISVSETVLDTNLRLDGTPEHPKTQIAVCPKTREREHLVGHRALRLRLYLALPQ